MNIYRSGAFCISSRTLTPNATTSCVLLKGAFRAALEAVHRARLEALSVPQADADAAVAERWHQYGKPEVVQFRHAAAALDRQAAALGKRISDVYMVRCCAERQKQTHTPVNQGAGNFRAACSR
jgi:hypothetical protein